MNLDNSYRRYRFVYSFRAWINERGTNEDHAHEVSCLRRQGTAFFGRCEHLRLWDLNTDRRAANIIRVVRRRRPFAFGVYVGPTMRLRFQLGLPR